MRLACAFDPAFRFDAHEVIVCFEVGCSSLGTFSTRFTELVGVPPSTYQRDAAATTEGIPSCVEKQVTRPVRHREAPTGGAARGEQTERDDQRPS